MSVLMNLEQAKAQLGIPLSLTDNDTDVALKMTQASDTVMDYLKGRADPAWTPDNVPGPVQAAALLFLTHFYENRGADMKADADVWMAVTRLLMRYRDPALA